MSAADRSRGDLQAKLKQLRSRNKELQLQLEDLEETRAKLAMSEERLSRLFAAVPFALFLETLAGQIVDCNPRAVEMLGYTRDELIGMHISKLVPPAVSDGLPELADEHLMMGGTVFTTTNLRKNGEEFPVEVSTRLVNLVEGKHAFVVVRDLSEGADR
jgi:PAS domain S-box-containing protein